MGESLRDRFKNLFPAVNLAVKIVGMVAALITIVIFVGAGWLWLRDALSDLVTADLQVWHLLLAVGLGLVIIICLLRRSGFADKKVDLSRYDPKEIDKYNVLWPINVFRGVGGPEFRAGKPMCPRCRTPLGFDSGEGVEPIPLRGETWKTIPIKGMTFRCLKDDSTYDLTKYKIGMLQALATAEDVARGKYNTALREAGL